MAVLTQNLNFPSYCLHIKARAKQVDQEALDINQWWLKISFLRLPVIAILLVATVMPCEIFLSEIKHLLAG